MGPRRVTLSGNSCCGAHWMEATAAVTADNEDGLPRFQGASGDAVLPYHLEAPAAVVGSR